ncbi:MAG: flagellar basal body rod protein FlgB [Oligoflexia bacterium]|nr:flagellar basal body rod protein FlgB [Oligoflexia bacterium]
MEVTSDKALKALATSLNFRQMRQDVISSNIANSETPGYKAKRVDFEDALKKALEIDSAESLKTESSLHYNVGEGGMNELQPEIYEDPNGVVSEDGNSVDRDAEMAEMAENKILYDASVQLLNKKLGMLKYAITSDR